MLFPHYLRWLPFSLAMLLSPMAAQAEVLVSQIIPDNTLGTESSVLIKDSDREIINGGAIRGSNLFHSFEAFTINTGQQVYFANPDNIETILSRVTGNTISDIDGLLGVDGLANLFLLNPNGIVFGPNAQLDIRGAFTASTADALEFTDGSLFSAVTPEGHTLLTMSVPLGVQLSRFPQANITSTGTLETNQDLALLGSQLYLEGQLVSGGNLILQAHDTVTIRDTEAQAFIARSGNDLTIQGNQGIDIWTLQHLDQTPFISKGDLALISNGEISGDAHFESGGGLQFLTLAGTPGTFVSLNDPIIFADGDVIFGDYTGAALKVESTGSIQAGTIRITGPDTTLTPDGSGSDEDLLASSRAAILRAGVDPFNNAPNIPQTVGGTVVTGGIVANQPPGSIVVTEINTSDDNGGNGGPIILEATGNITARDLLAFAETFIDKDAGNGGNISIVSSEGNILTRGKVSSFSQSLGDDGNAGISGRIFIEAADTVTTGELNTFSFLNSPTSGDNADNAGNIFVSSNSGNIAITERIRAFSSSTSGGSGNGGNISISSVSGNISTNEIDASSSFFIRNGSPLTTIPTNPVGNGGNIFITTTSGDILNNGFLISSAVSRNSAVGNGGDIYLLAENGAIRNNDVRTSTVAASGIDGNTGTGGNVTLRAATNISDLEVSTLSSAGESGDIIIQGTGNNFVVSNLNLITSGQLIFSNPVFGDDREQVISLASSNFDRSGQTTIISDGDLILDDVELRNDSNRAAPAGNVEISSTGSLQLINGSQILSNTNDGSSGNGGNVTLTGTENVILNDNSLINTDTDGSGRAGGITIRTPQLTLQNGSQITAASNSPANDGTGGSISLEVDAINLANNETEISVSTSGPADAGSITLKPFDINGNITISTTDNGSPLSASTANGSRGRGGNIIIQNADTALLRNTGLVTSSDGSGDAGNIIVKNVNVLLMREGSLIQVGASANGNGGNIDIDADLVITVPDEDNDILADTNTGAGGNIEITADRILGFREVQAFSNNLRGNTLNDISAQSERGVDGDISISNFAVDPNQGLSELPTDVADPTNQIVQGCGLRESAIVDNQTGDFIITGRGGQTPRPTDIVDEDILLDDLGTETIQAELSTPTIESTSSSSQKSSLIEDAQEAVVTESGDVFLIAQGSWHSSISCAVLQ